MVGRILVVAIGCGRVQGMLALAAKHPFVVFGTMERERLAGFKAVLGKPAAVADLPVYFYETG